MLCVWYFCVTRCSTFVFVVRVLVGSEGDRCRGGGQVGVNRFADCACAHAWMRNAGPFWAEVQELGAGGGPYQRNDRNLNTKFVFGVDIFLLCRGTRKITKRWWRWSSSKSTKCLGNVWPPCPRLSGRVLRQVLGHT